jgi:hypothetical protein
MDLDSNFSAFLGDHLFYSGSLRSLLRKIKAECDETQSSSLLIFEDSSGRQRDFDLRGNLKEVLERVFPETGSSGPGRPKLGVVSREVTLLPKHWAWLESENPGISGALRRLVDQAMRQEPEKDKAKRLREALGRILWSLAGNFAGFEEASRALYAKQDAQFKKEIKDWPEEIRIFCLEKQREWERVEAGEA